MLLGLRRSALLAALLSFLLPGLGQAWAGAVRRGLVFLLPVLLLVAVAVALWVRSPGYLIGLALQPGVLLALILINVALFVYRGVAIVDAYRCSRRRWRRGFSPRVPPLTYVAVAVLLLATGLMHAAVAYVGYQTYDLMTGVFQPETGALLADDGRAGTLEPPPREPPREPPARERTAATRSAPPAPARTPAPRPAWAANGRLDVLIIGSDAGPGRWALRTDTLILASVEVATGRAALFGIPRNLINVPLPAESAGAFPCRCYPDLLNGLYVYAMEHPNEFPGGSGRGFRAVAGAVQELTGVDLDGMVVADLNGFIELIDAVGGLHIDVPAPVVDNAYPTEDGRRFIRISIPAGPQHMNGSRALQYARSRNQDSDYARMVRQQLVLVALRRQVNVCSLLPRFPELVRILKKTVRTNIPISELPELLELAQRVKADQVERVTFAPPRYPERLRARDVARIRSAVKGAFEGPATRQTTPDPGKGAC